MGEQPPAAGGIRKRPPEGGRLLSLKRTSRRKYVSAGWLRRRGSSNLFSQCNHAGVRAFLPVASVSHTALIEDESFVVNTSGTPREGPYCIGLPGWGRGFRCIFTRNIFAELSRGFLNNWPRSLWSPSYAFVSFVSLRFRVSYFSLSSLPFFFLFFINGYDRRVKCNCTDTCILGNDETMVTKFDVSFLSFFFFVFSSRLD